VARFRLAFAGMGACNLREPLPSAAAQEGLVRHGSAPPAGSAQFAGGSGLATDRDCGTRPADPHRQPVVAMLAPECADAAFAQDTAPHGLHALWSAEEDQISAGPQQAEQAGRIATGRQKRSC